MLRVDLDAIQGEIERAGHGHRRAVVMRYAGMLGVSKDTIYRELRKAFGKKKTLNRQKKVPQHLIDMIADMKIEAARLSLTEREMSTDICIDLLRERGVQGADQLTVSTVNRRLREAGYRIDDPKVFVEPEYATQEDQLDFSRSKYFQIWKYDPVREDYLMRVSGRELHYKKGDRRLRTWICQVKNSFSRLRIARAYAATSEDGFIGLDTLYFYWCRPEDQHPLRYVPDCLKTDNGSFARRAEVKAALGALDIQFDKARPYNHDSQGKVESGFKSLWRRFEMPLAYKLGAGATIYLSEYNELLHEHLAVKDAQLPHPVYKDTREAIYRMGILRHPPRTVDVDILQVACRVFVRSVPQTLMIQLDGDAYEAPSYTMGKRVRVYRNMLGELMGELLEEDRKPFVLQPFRRRARGDFSHRPHATYRQERATEIDRLATKNGKRVFMPPKPKTIVPDSPFVDAGPSVEFAGIYQARVYIGEQLRCVGETYRDYADVFDPLLQDDLSKESIDAVLKEIKQQTKKMRLAL